MKIKAFHNLSESQTQRAEAILRNCVHCGLCNATCPTYQVLGDERDGPRGRIYLIKQVLEGEPVSLKTQQHLDNCLTCLNCETTCPAGVSYHSLLNLGREQLEKQRLRPWLERAKRWTLTQVLPYPQRFQTLLKLARLSKPLLPKKLADLIPQPRQKLLAQVTEKPTTRKMLLLDGCVQSGLAPEINQAARLVLQQLGIELISAPQAGCCGALGYHTSAIEQGLNFAKQNIDVCWSYLENGVEKIVSTASGCGLMIKDYAEILADDPVYATKAERISKAACDIVEVLLAEEDLTSLTLATRQKVAVQTPCTLQHGQKLSGTIEQVLQKLGFQLVSVADAHLCCGSAGTYSLLQPQLSAQLAKNKVAVLERSQADVIVTANIGCLMQLTTKTKIPVKHWVELVAEARFT